MPALHTRQRLGTAGALLAWLPHSISPSCLHSSSPSYLHAIRPSYLHSSSPSYLPACLPAAVQMSANNQTGKLALIRAYHHGYFMYSNDHCELIHAETAPLFDTCDWTSKWGTGACLRAAPGQPGSTICSWFAS